MLARMRSPFAAALLLPLALTACPRRVPTASGPAHPVTYPLLAGASEAETTSRTETRTDVFVHTNQFGHVPVVVAKGEVGPLSLQGGRAQLFSDEACTQGISVDNFILFEVLGAGGKITHRFAVGYHTGLTVADQVPDNVGPSAFVFRPGLDVTAQLPPEATFTLRATALDYGGVGRVTPVYLRVSPAASVAPSDDDLRNK